MQPPLTDESKGDFTITPEETKRLEECFKDQKFRDLLSDYVKEISNPQTKLAYEEYLKQVENEGGSPENRKLMKPIPMFCVKAKIIPNTDNDNDVPSKSRKHIFINCCSGKLVQDAKLTNSSGFDHVLNCSGSKRAGLCWQIPYILGHKRFDSNDGHIIYDIAFSENTKTLLNQQKSFKNIVIKTALEAVDGVETEYNLYINNKKYKILKTNKFKGDIDPPLMSVFIETEAKRMINKVEKMPELEEIKYKIIESGDTNMGEYWGDKNLLIQPFKKCKQIYVVCKLKNVKNIKDVNCNLDKSKKTVTVSVVNGKYKKCVIDLHKYDIISSSMNASWYKNKNELKLTFNIKPFTKKEIDAIKAKYLNVYNREKEKEIIIPTKSSLDDGNKAFLIKEVKTKRIRVNDCNDDKKEKEKDGVPLCHHKLAMKCIENDGKSFWVCCKAQNEKCTAFKWNKIKKRLNDDFEVEKREKFDKIVLLVRIRNIIQSSVDVDFGKNGEIKIEFETHEYKYCKTIEIKHNIDVGQSKFDVNCRNLLIMAVKDKVKEKEKENDIGTCVDDILNDSVLFEID